MIAYRYLVVTRYFTLFLRFVGLLVKIYKLVILYIVFVDKGILEIHCVVSEYSLDFRIVGNFENTFAVSASSVYPYANASYYYCNHYKYRAYRHGNSYLCFCR